MKKTHELKILPEHFWPVVTGHYQDGKENQEKDL
jgi:hypothetical protein